VREAVEDNFTGDFIRKAIEEEIIPTLELSKDELLQFASDVLERFQNPSIRHELMSIALNSISKYQVRVLPSVLEYIKRKGKPPSRLLYSLAALIRFYKGEWQGQPIALNDTPAILAFFKKAWASNDAASVVKAVLSNKEFWKIDLTTVDGVATEVEKSLKSIIADEKSS
jgi:tagaturonate reductase